MTHSQGQRSDVRRTEETVETTLNLSFFEPHWRTLPGAQQVPDAHKSSAACVGAFVALISGERYLAGALCLRSSMIAVQSACPLVFIHDDRPDNQLSARSLRSLTEAVGSNNLVALSALFSQRPGSTHYIRMNYTHWQKPRFNEPQKLMVPSAVTAPGRVRMRGHATRLHDPRSDNGKDPRSGNVMASDPPFAPGYELAPGRRLYHTNDKKAAKELFATHLSVCFPITYMYMYMCLLRLLHSSLPP